MRNKLLLWGLSLWGLSLWAGLLLALTLGLSGGAQAQAVYQGAAPPPFSPNPNLLINLPVVAGRGAGVYSGVSGGTQTGETYRYRHTVARPCSNVSLVYGNFAMTANGDVSPTNAITLKATLETVTGSTSTFYPVLFGGLPGVTLQPGQTIRADPLPVGLTAGQIVFTRSFVTVGTAGQAWPVRLSAGGGNSLLPVINEEGYVTGITDNTQTPASNFTLSGAPAGYGPLAIIGTPSDGKTLGTLFIIGDSISISGTDNGWFADGTLSPEETFITRAGNGRFGYVQGGLGGETSGGWGNPGKIIRQAIASGCDHFLIEMGVNDWSSAANNASLQASRLAIISGLIAQGVPASKIFQTTVTPQSGSTDAWATTTNQSFATGKGPGPSERTNFNDWVRTNPGGVRGIDVADAVEVNAAGAFTRNGGYWHTNPGVTGPATPWTFDGTHPGAAGHTAMAQALITAFNAGWFNN